VRLSADPARHLQSAIELQSKPNRDRAEDVQDAEVRQCLDGEELAEAGTGASTSLRRRPPSTIPARRRCGTRPELVGDFGQHREQAFAKAADIGTMESFR